MSRRPDQRPTRNTNNINQSYPHGQYNEREVKHPRYSSGYGADYKWPSIDELMEARQAPAYPISSNNVIMAPDPDFTDYKEELREKVEDWRRTKSQVSQPQYYSSPIVPPEQNQSRMQPPSPPSEQGTSPMEKMMSPGSNPYFRGQSSEDSTETDSDVNISNGYQDSRRKLPKRSDSNSIFQFDVKKTEYRSSRDDYSWHNAESAANAKQTLFKPSRSNHIFGVPEEVEATSYRTSAKDGYQNFSSQSDVVRNPHMRNKQSHHIFEQVGGSSNTQYRTLSRDSYTWYDSHDVDQAARDVRENKHVNRNDSNHIVGVFQGEDNKKRRSVDR